MPRGGKREGAGRKAAAKASKEAEKLKALDIRRQRYLDERSKGKNKFQAGIDAGFSEAMAKNAKARIETPDLRKAFAELIQAVIPAEKIVARIAEGLDARETKLFSFQGMVFDREDMISWTERREYARLAAEYGGYFTPKQEIDNKHSGKVTLEQLVIGDE